MPLDSSLTRTGGTCSALARMNVVNREFCVEMSEKFREAMVQPHKAKPVMESHQDEVNRGVPLRWQKSLEHTWVQIETSQKLARQQVARVAGLARKAGDALGKLIQIAVGKNRHITVGQLIRELTGPFGAGLEIRVESHAEARGGKRLIYFTDDDGRSRAISVSALKNRLYRAKKQVSRLS